jgi:hypothetical protein
MKLTKTDRRIIQCVGTYVLVGFLMFGWLVNHTECRKVYKHDGTVLSEHCESRNANAAAAGVFWPIAPLIVVVYYAGQLAIAVTKWP